MMSSQDPWTILAEQGILFRPSATYADCWEYTIPTLMEIWYGPYLTREEALRAALRHLLSQAQNNPNTIASAVQGATETSASEQLAAQLQLLRQQLFELHRTEALLGIAHAPEIRPRIEKLKEQIKHIQERIEQSSSEQQ